MEKKARLSEDTLLRTDKHTQKKREDDEILPYLIQYRCTLTGDLLSDHPFFDVFGSSSTRDFVVAFSSSFLAIRPSDDKSSRLVTNFVRGVTTVIDDVSKTIQRIHYLPRQTKNILVFNQVGSDEVAGRNSSHYVATVANMLVELWLDTAKQQHQHAVRFFLHSIVPSAKFNVRCSGIPLRIRISSIISNKPVTVVVEAIKIENTKDSNQFDIPIDYKEKTYARENIQRSPKRNMRGAQKDEQAQHEVATETHRMSASMKSSPNVRDIELGAVDCGAFISHAALSKIANILNIMTRNLSITSEYSSESRNVFQVNGFDELLKRLSVVDSGTDKTEFVLDALKRALFLSNFGAEQYGSGMTESERYRKWAILYALGVDAPKISLNRPGWGNPPPDRDRILEEASREREQEQYRNPNRPTTSRPESEPSYSEPYQAEFLNYEEFLDSELVADGDDTLSLRDFVNKYFNLFNDNVGKSREIVAGILFGGLLRWREFLFPPELNNLHKLLLEIIFRTDVDVATIKFPPGITTPERMSLIEASNAAELMTAGIEIPSEWTISLAVADLKISNIKLTFTLPDKVIEFPAGTEIELNIAAMSISFDWAMTPKMDEVGIAVSIFTMGMSTLHTTNAGAGRFYADDVKLAGTLTTGPVGEVDFEIDASATEGIIGFDFIAGNPLSPFLGSGIGSSIFMPFIDEIFYFIFSWYVERFTILNSLESIQQGWHAYNGPTPPLNATIGNFRGDSGIFALGKLNPDQIGTLNDNSFRTRPNDLTFFMSDRYIESWINMRSRHESVTQDMVIGTPFLAQGLPDLSQLASSRECDEMWLWALASDLEGILNPQTIFPERFLPFAMSEWVSKPNEPFKTNGWILPPWNNRPRVQRGQPRLFEEITQSDSSIEFPPQGDSSWAARLHVDIQYRCYAGTIIRGPHLVPEARTKLGTKLPIPPIKMKWDSRKLGICSLAEYANITFRYTVEFKLGFTGGLTLFPELALQPDLSPSFTATQGRSSISQQDFSDPTGLAYAVRLALNNYFSEQCRDIFSPTLRPVSPSITISDAICSMMGIRPIGNLYGLTEIPDTLFDVFRVNGEDKYRRSERYIAWGVNVIEDIQKMFP